jgi:hypothetical protein
MKKTTAGLCRIGKPEIDGRPARKGHALVEPGIIRDPACCLLCRYRHNRHSFAVGTLLRWYRQGLDPAARLHHLSTFLGHVRPETTAVYLTITSDLYAEANRRFEALASPAISEVRP